MPIDRFEPTVFFDDPKQAYCCRLRPLSETPGFDMQYCSLPLGHQGAHVYHVRWARVPTPKQASENKSKQPSKNK